ncbi:SLBB domain-containing protein [Cellulomonas soli]
MSLDDPRPDGPHARLQGLLAPPRVGLSVPHGPSAPAAPVHGPSAPHAPTAGEDALSAQALARAAVDYRASYGDPVVRAAAVPRRRVRWVVPWRLAAAAGVLVVLLAGSVALRQLALHPGAPVTLPVPVPAASSGPAVAGGASAGAGTAVQADAQAVDGATGSEMVVHVVGQVAAPGVVRLPAGARVADAIAAAGDRSPRPISRRSTWLAR